MKKIDKNISKVFYENIQRPLRTKKDFILLLLETIKLLYVEEVVVTSQGKVSIVIDKMSRIFYQVKNKIFSIVFPFSIEAIDNQYRVYDIDLDVDIDSKLISIMISILKQLEFSKVSAEQMLDTYYDVTQNEEDSKEVDYAWKLLFKLSFVELGYIRYDYDEKHQNKIYHPLHHLDINYSSNGTYKIGLRKEIELEDMISLLDVKHSCSYLEIK